MRAPAFAISSSRFSMSAWWIAGATSPPCRSEMATPTWTASLVWNPSLV